MVFRCVPWFAASAKSEELSQLPQVEIVRGDLSRPETLEGALRGVDRAMLISSSDPSMLEVQSNFIDAAAKAGVQACGQTLGHYARA